MTQYSDDKENLERLQQPERNSFEQREEEIAGDRMMAGVLKDPEAPKVQEFQQPFKPTTNTVARSSQEDGIEITALPGVIPFVAAKNCAPKGDAPEAEKPMSVGGQLFRVNQPADKKVAADGEVSPATPAAEKPMAVGGQLFRVNQPADKTVAAAGDIAPATPPVDKKISVAAKSEPVKNVSEENTTGTTGDAIKKTGTSNAVVLNSTEENGPKLDSASKVKTDEKATALPLKPAAGSSCTTDMTSIKPTPSTAGTHGTNHEDTSEVGTRKAAAQMPASSPVHTERQEPNCDPITKTCALSKKNNDSADSSELPARPVSQTLPHTERAAKAPVIAANTENPNSGSDDRASLPNKKDDRTNGRDAGDRGTNLPGQTCVTDTRTIPKPTSDGSGRDATANSRPTNADSQPGPLPVAGSLPRIGSAASTDKVAAPSTDRVTTPSTDRVTTPSTDRVTTPSTDRVTTPSTDRVTAPSTDKVAVASTDKVAAPSTDKVTALSADKVTALSADKVAVAASDKGITFVPSVVSDNRAISGSEVSSDWKQSDFAKLPMLGQNIDIKIAPQIDNSTTISTKSLTSGSTMGSGQDLVASAARPTIERQGEQSRLGAEGSKEKVSIQTSSTKDTQAPLPTTGRETVLTNGQTPAKDAPPSTIAVGTDLTATAKAASTGSIDISQQSTVRETNILSNREIAATSQPLIVPTTSENKGVNAKTDGVIETRGLNGKFDIPADNRGLYQPADKMENSTKGEKEQENKVTKKDDKNEIVNPIVWGLDQGNSRTNKPVKNDKAETKRTPPKGTQQRAKYIVRQGDTIESIAQAQLKDARFANLIITINRGTIRFVHKDGTQQIVLRVGQALWLPNQSERDIYARAIFYTKRTAAASPKSHAVLSTEETEEQLPEVTLMNSLPNNIEPTVQAHTTLVSLVSSLDKIRQAGQRKPVQLSEIEYQLSQSKLLTKLTTVAETVDSAIWFDSDASINLNKSPRSASAPSAGTPKGALEANTKGPSTLFPRFFEHRDSAQKNIVDKLAESCRVVTSQGNQCEDDFNTELQIEVQGSWMPVAAYEYRRGHGYRYTYYTNSEQRPFPMDLPLSVVLEMAREDFSRNWTVYCQEFSRQRTTAKTAE